MAACILADCLNGCAASSQVVGCDDIKLNTSLLLNYDKYDMLVNVWHRASQWRTVVRRWLWYQHTERSHWQCPVQTHHHGRYKHRLPERNQEMDVKP